MGKRGQVVYIGEWVEDWTAADGSRWEVVTEWADVGGRAQCVGIGLRSYLWGDPLGEPIAAEQQARGRWPVLVPAGGGGKIRAVQSQVLRQISMRLVEQARQKLLAEAQDLRRKNLVLDLSPLFEDDVHAVWHAGADVERLFTASGGRGGRRLVGTDGEPLPPNEALAEVAKLYRAAWSAGAHPTKAVADAIGISRSAAAKRVRRARDAGLLPPTKQGQMKAIDEREPR